MDKPQPNELRTRLRELLAIPDRDRTDAEWDELNELEILLAPGNREGAPDPRRAGGMPMQGQRNPGGQPHGQPHGQGQKPGGGKNHKRSRKRKGR